MSRAPLFLVIGLVLGGAGGGAVGFRLAREAVDRGEEPSEAAEVSGAIAQVATVAVEAGSLTRAISTYGAVASAPGATASMTLPYDCRVLRLAVTIGQAVAVGEAIIEVEPGPEARLQLREARATRAAAAGTLEAAQRRFESRLATNQELQQARNELALAELRLADWSARGVDDSATTTLVAPAAGSVTLLAVKPGALIPAGTTLVELGDPDRLEARLGLDPAQTRAVASGQELVLTPVGGDQQATTKATITAIGIQVDPTTRLVDAVARIPAGSGLIAGESVRAVIPQPAIVGLVVPRPALVIDDAGASLFLVVDGKAVRRAVTVLGEDSGRTVVQGDGIAAGDLVVVAGNHQLLDGMAVVAEFGR